MDTSNSEIRRKALGISMAATPPMQKMHAEAIRMFEAGHSREEVDAYLCERAVRDPLIGLRPFLSINRQAARLSAPRVIMEVAKYWAKQLKKKRVQDCLMDYAHDTKIDRWIADYILEWIDTGEPPAFQDTKISWVGEINIGPPDEQSKLVVLIANQAANPREAADQFVEYCLRVFPSETFSHKREAIRDAERVRQFVGGLSDYDIAKAELDAEGWDLLAANKREYNQEVERRANAICQSRNRWIEYLTKLTG